MLDITSLTTAYDGFEFGPVDLTVGAEVLAVLGPSGSGKTTLLSLLAGLVEPDGGSVSLGGRSLVGRPIEERGAGLVFQDGALFPHLTARENIAFAATSRTRPEDLADRLEVTSVLDRRPASLSGGERQRVALARTLAADPDVLLLDEPLSSLDAPIRRRLRDELHDLFRSLDIPVVYVTHDQRAATVLGDRIAVLREGRVEQVGTPSAVLDRPASEFVARFTGSENVFSGTVDRGGDGLVVINRGAVDLRVSTETAHPVGSTVTACVRPARLEIPPVNGRHTADNTLVGTVRRQLNEGDHHRVVVRVDDADLTLVGSVRPTTFESLDADVGSTVRLSIPPAAIHLLAAE